MPNEKFIFRTDLTVDDFRGLSWLIVRRSMILLVFLIDIFLCYSLFERVGRSWIIISIIAIVIFFIVYWLERFFINFRAKRIFNLSSVSSELILSLDSEGITQLSKSGETKLAWRDVMRVCSDKRCHYVFLNSNQAFYFPKRSFKSKEDENRFSEIIIENIEPHKVRLG